MFHDEIDYSKSIAWIFFGLEVGLYFMAFFMFMLLFARLYRMFIDLIEVLLFFDNAEIQILKETNKAFLEMIECKTSGKRSIHEESQAENKSPRSKGPDIKSSPLEAEKSRKDPQIEIELLEYEIDGNFLSN